MGKSIALVIFLVASLSGCQSSRSSLVEDKEFMLVIPNSDDTFESLSLRYFGNTNSKDLIKRINPHLDSLEMGHMVAIPKANIYRGGFFSDGYTSVPVLCYHQFTSDRGKQQPMVLHVDDFERQMQYLFDNEYSVITLDDLARFIQGDIPLPDKSVVLTVDDGFKSFYNYALPILERYKFNTTVFIYPDFVGGRLSLTWNQIKRLENHPLVSIESHSLTHDNLKQKINESEAQYLERLEREITLPQKFFTRRINKRTHHYAYPFGDTSDELIAMLQDENYDLGLTVERGVNASYTPSFLIKRNMIFGGRSFDHFVNSLHASGKKN